MCTPSDLLETDALAALHIVRLMSRLVFFWSTHPLCHIAYLLLSYLSLLYLRRVPYVMNMITI